VCALGAVTAACSGHIKVDAHTSHKLEAHTGHNKAALTGHNKVDSTASEQTIAGEHGAGAQRAPVQTRAAQGQGHQWPCLTFGAVRSSRLGKQ